MRIQEITDKQTWQSFVGTHAPRLGAFLHDWEYGELERGARRLGVYKNENLVAVALISIKKLPLGFSYALIERGPIVKSGTDIRMVVEAIAAEQDVAFVRFEPPLFSSAGGSASGGKEGQGVVIGAWAKKTIHVSPEETLLLDLTTSEDELLSAMHAKTRYNIRLAQKKGVLARELRHEEREGAWRLFEETAARDKFRLHSRARYEDWLDRFAGARLVGAFYGGELLAVNLMVDAFRVRTYLHGASSSAHRDVMAPYALHWHEITEAKKAGFAAYDFWGISEENPAWKGITRFKLGFGMERVRYPGTFDFCKSYWAYKMYTILRALWRKV